MRSIPELRDNLGLISPLERMTREGREGISADIIAPKEALAYWSQKIVERTRRHFDAVIAITGSEGVGKSTLALRLAFECYPKFKLDSLCYSGSDVIREYKHSHEGSIIFYDEGVRGLLAGPRTVEQTALIQAFTLVRELGCILFICAPDIWMIDKQVRGRRATLWFHVQRRGLARVHVRDERLRYEADDNSLHLAMSPDAPYISFEPFRSNSKLWLQYLRIKHERLQEFLRQTEAMLIAHTPQAGEALTRLRRTKSEAQARWRAKRKSTLIPT